MKLIDHTIRELGERSCWRIRDFLNKHKFKLLVIGDVGLLSIACLKTNWLAFFVIIILICGRLNENWLEKRIKLLEEERCEYQRILKTGHYISRKN